MALSQLSKNEYDLVLGLPYRAGIFVSHADDVEGEQDDEMEVKALLASIKQAKALHQESKLVSEVCDCILSSEVEWERWENEAFHILRTSQHVIEIVKSNFGLDEAKHYRALVMEVSASVARAASELDAFDDWKDEEPEGFFSGMIVKIMGGFSSMSQDDKDHPVNISPAEDSALSQLSALLKIKD